MKDKLLYAGGDDVLALVAVDDLFDAMPSQGRLVLEDFEFQ